MQYRALVSFVVTIIMMAGISAAQLSEENAGYFAGPEGLLLTKKERKQWKKVSSDEQAETFIQLFWARRDPDLKTRINELKLEFERRVEYADSNWGFADVRGAMSDRGKVLILLGPYQERYEIASGTDSGESRFTEVEVGDQRVINFSERPAMERWVYQLAKLPNQTKELEFEVIFVQTQAGQDCYELDRTSRINMRALNLMGEAPEWYLLNPDLQELPEYPESTGLVPGSTAATSEQLSWLAGDQRPWPPGSGVVSKPGLIGASHRFAWVHLLLPTTSPTAELAIGRLRQAGTGDQIGSFAMAVEPVSLRYGHAYRVSVPIEAGQWQLDLALAGADGPLAVTTVEVTAAEPEPGATIYSPMCWGAESFQTNEMPLGDPFNIGGWVIHPRADNAYQSKESLTYGCLVIAPKLDDQGKPEVTTSVTLVIGEQRMTLIPSQLAPLAQIGPDLWMFAGALPLQGFKQTGAYQLEIELSQPADDSRSLTEIPLIIVE
jgi:GWxTD domain-containing protein